MSELAQSGAPVRSARLRLSAELWRRPWLKVVALLALPVLAFAVVYLGSLVALFISSFWEVDSFTGKVVHTWTLSNFSSLIHDPVYRTIAFRTIWIAAAIGTPMIAPMIPNSEPNASTLTSTVKPETSAAFPMIVGCRM